MTYKLNGGTFVVPVTNDWIQTNSQEIRIICDTTTAPTLIKLPKIDTLGGIWSVKIFVTDYTNTANVNNITIECAKFDQIDDSGIDNVKINKAGRTRIFSIASDYCWVSDAS